MKKLPTKEEIEELINNTTSEWVKVNYIKGRRFTSKANGNSIFLPAAGFRVNTSFLNVGMCGYYWSSSLNGNFYDFAWSLNFDDGLVNISDFDIRYSRQPVRTISDTPEPGFVDLGLSVYWSECNEGADKPEKYGSHYTWAEAMKKFNNNSDMETKMLQIQIPEGHEVDLENSNLAEGKIVFKKKEVLTYTDVIKELYQGDGKGAWMNNSAEPNALPVYLPQSAEVPISNWAVCTSAKHAKKLKAINMLLNTAAYLNGDWVPDWKNENEHKYYFYIYEEDSLRIKFDWVLSTIKAIVYFKSRELAEKAIKILGKDVIRQALSTDW